MARLQCSSFQDLYCCVTKGSFFSVMGMALLYGRLNIQNPSALHDFWLQNSSWHTDNGKEAVRYIFFSQQVIASYVEFSPKCFMIWRLNAHIYVHTHDWNKKNIYKKSQACFTLKKSNHKYSYSSSFRRGFSCKSFMLVCLKL